MSRLRPTTPAKAGTFSPKGATAYLMIYNALRDQDGLIHGKLDGPRGEHCAIGWYFDVNEKTALDLDLIDEVAAVNDSVPNATKKQRRDMVSRWLRWKLTQLGMPGFRTLTL
jgi:hypothetical protein